MILNSQPPGADLQAWLALLAQLDGHLPGQFKSLLQLIGFI
jgi:hypothetical protein